MGNLINLSGTSLLYNQPKGEFVDLGLPSGLLWMDRNIGANAPEDFGLYYQWGDIEGHTIDGYAYSQENYNAKGLNNISGNLSLAYDAAYNALGVPYRMPSGAEAQELIDNCTWVYTTINGVRGFLFTSNSNRNTIFFPLGDHGGSTAQIGTYGRYWTSTYNSDIRCEALLFSKVSNSEGRVIVSGTSTWSNRLSGLNIRVVRLPV